MINAKYNFLIILFLFAASMVNGTIKYIAPVYIPGNDTVMVPARTIPLQNEIIIEPDIPQTSLFDPFIFIKNLLRNLGLWHD